MLFPEWVVWVGIVLAIVSIARLCLRLAQRLPAMPKRVPLGLRFDGRPRAEGPKAALWLGPALVTVLAAALMAVFLVAPPPDYERLSTAFVFLIVAEAAWFIAWTIDRLAELARKMTYRVSPGRLLLALAPLVGTIAITIAIAAAERI